MYYRFTHVLSEIMVVVLSRCNTDLRPFSHQFAGPESDLPIIRAVTFIKLHLDTGWDLQVLQTS